MDTLVLILVVAAVAILFFGMIILTTSMSNLGEIKEDSPKESTASTKH